MRVHLRTLICRVDPRTPASAVPLFSPSGGAEGAADAGTAVDAAVATFTEPTSANGVATTTSATATATATTATTATTADADTASFADRGGRLAIADAGITAFTATTM